MENMIELAVMIDSIGGNCPIQAQGTINGEPFYFRARGNSWSIAIGGDVIANSIRGAADKPDWFYEEEGHPNAGWMDEAEAVAFIHEAAQRYLSEA